MVLPQLFRFRHCEYVSLLKLVRPEPNEKANETNDELFLCCPRATLELHTALHLLLHFWRDK